jgi:hypothetical protein
VVRLRRVASPDGGQRGEVNTRFQEHPPRGYFSPCWNGLVRPRGSPPITQATMLIGVAPRTCDLVVTREVAKTEAPSYYAGGSVPDRATGLLEAR